MVGLCVPETGSGNRWRLRCFLVRILLLVGAQGIKDGAEHLSRPKTMLLVLRYVNILNIIFKTLVPEIPDTHCYLWYLL